MSIFDADWYQAKNWLNDYFSLLLQYVVVIILAAILLFHLDPEKYLKYILIIYKKNGPRNKIPYVKVLAMTILVKNIFGYCYLAIFQISPFGWPGFHQKFSQN